MRGPKTPIDVLITNTVADRDLEDRHGFKEAGYVYSGERLQEKLTGASSLYIATKNIHKLIRKFTPTVAAKRNKRLPSTVTGRRSRR